MRSVYGSLPGKRFKAQGQWSNGNCSATMNIQKHQGKFSTYDDEVQSQISGSTRVPPSSIGAAPTDTDICSDTAEGSDREANLSGDDAAHIRATGRSQHQNSTTTERRRKPGSLRRQLKHRDRAWAFNARMVKAGGEDRHKYWPCNVNAENRAAAEAEGREYVHLDDQYLRDLAAAMDAEDRKHGVNADQSWRERITSLVTQIKMGEVFECFEDIPKAIRQRSQRKCLTQKPDGQWFCMLCGKNCSLDPEDMHLLSKGHETNLTYFINVDVMCGQADTQPDCGHGLRHLTSDFASGCRWYDKESILSFWGVHLETSGTTILQRFYSGVPIEVQTKDGSGALKATFEPSSLDIDHLELFITLYTGGKGKYGAKSIVQIPWSECPATREEIWALPDITKKKLGLMDGTPELGWWPIWKIHFTPQGKRRLIRLVGARNDNPREPAATFSICVDQALKTPLIAWGCHNVRMRALVAGADAANHVVDTSKFMAYDWFRPKTRAALVTSLKDTNHHEEADALSQNKREVSLDDYVRAVTSARERAEGDSTKGGMYLQNTLQHVYIVDVNPEQNRCHPQVEDDAPDLMEVENLVEWVAALHLDAGPDPDWDDDDDWDMMDEPPPEDMDFEGWQHADGRPVRFRGRD